MENFDLCFAWNAAEDADFARVLRKACGEKSYALLDVTPETVQDIKRELDQGILKFRALVDRASDTDSQFVFLEEWSRSRGGYVINRKEYVKLAIDKAAMHAAFIGGGIQTPYTIQLPSYQEQPEIPPIELAKLGEKFVIKPAKGGGGEGVVEEAKTWDDVLRARQDFPSDSYLLQVKIIATQLDERQAWFRVIFCSGEIYPCWWNTRSHVYREVTLEEEEKYKLHPLREITSSIAGICKLELFSTEIALTAENLFIVVDYVNDVLDLRLQSSAKDGVPDGIVERLTARILSLVEVNASAV